MHNQKRNIKGGRILAAPLVGLLLATTPVVAPEPVAEPVAEVAEFVPDANTVAVEVASGEELTEVVAPTLVELAVVV